MDHDKIRDRILSLLSKEVQGMTIQELSAKFNLSRSTMTVLLSYLEGNGKIKHREIGRAKLFSLNKSIKRNKASKNDKGRQNGKEKSKKRNKKSQKNRKK